MTTRHGGVSRDNYASLNLGAFSGDDPGAVRENRRLLAERMGFSPEALFVPYQTHEAEIRVINRTFLSQSEEKKVSDLYGVDGIATDVPGVCVAVSTADCVPVLFYAPDKGVVAAVHAGWRGTVKQIVMRAVAVMRERWGCNPSEMVAGIGPSISQSAFEVGDEVVEAFRASGAWSGKEWDSLVARHPETKKAHIDLWEANRLLLLKSGLQAPNIEVAGICTYTYNKDFFSARRLGIRSGRILSGIFIKSSC